MRVDKRGRELKRVTEKHSAALTLPSVTRSKRREREKCNRVEQSRRERGKKEESKRDALFGVEVVLGEEIEGASACLSWQHGEHRNALAKLLDLERIRVGFEVHRVEDESVGERREVPCGVEGGWT
jgi:hypothetical protein